MDDSQLAKFVPLFGDRIAAKEEAKRLLGKGNTQLASSNKKHKLMAKLLEKVTHKTEEAGVSSEVRRKERSGNRNASKSTRRVELGWMHYNNETKTYKQVRAANGGGTRHLNVGHSLTMADLMEMGKNLFFPGSLSPKGLLSEFEFKIADFSGSILPLSITVAEIYNSMKIKILRVYMATNKVVDPDQTHNSESTSISDIDKTQPGTPVLKSSVDSRAFDFIQESNKPNEGTQHHTNTLPSTSFLQFTPQFSSTQIVSRCETKSDGPSFSFTTDQVNDKDNNNLHTLTATAAGNLSVKYSLKQVSSYCEVITTQICHSIEACKELIIFDYPEIRDIKEVNPLLYGYKAVKIESTVCFVDTLVDDEKEEVIFPNEKKDQDNIIVHSPDEVCGLDASTGQLVIGIVTKYHNKKQLIAWYKDGQLMCSDIDLCLYIPTTPGSYSAVVQFDDIIAVSKPVKVSYSKADSNKSHRTETFSVPTIKKSDIVFQETDVLGEGTFGKVFKGQWLGTTVAIKKVHMRRMKAAIEAVIAHEITMLSRVRHPNIVQLMAVAMEPTECLLVSECIEGADLENVIFGSKKDAIGLIDNQKPFIAKQSAQAVAYLHGLQPAIIHQDIKPANFLITAKTLVTKLCDLGLSQIKSVHTMTTANFTGAGTPMYMAPERLLHNAKGSCMSDIWSLGQTWLELFTETESWYPNDIVNGDIITAVKDKMGAGEPPTGVEKLTIHRDIIIRCLHKDASKRPTAYDLSFGYKW